MNGCWTPTTRRTASSDTDLRRLAEALDRVAAAVAETEPRDGPRGLALAVLDAAAADGPQRMARLAERERVSQPSMSRVVQRLTDAGLIERNADPSDGRAVIVTITPAGRTLRDDLHGARLRPLVEHLSCLPEVDQDALFAAIGALEAIGSTPPPDRPSESRQRRAPSRPGGDSDRRNGV